MATDSRQPQPSSEEPAETETTPLLSRPQEDSGDENTVNGRNEQQEGSPAASLLRSMQDGSNGKKSRLRRWPSLLALSILCAVVIVILVFVFVAPEIMEEYAMQAVRFEPTVLTVVSFSASGLVAHVQGDLQMDGSQVKRKPVRDLGRFGTWIMRAVETKATKIKISLPEYGDSVVGTVELPPIKFDVRDRHITAVDFSTPLTIGSKHSIRHVADDWLKGSLGKLRVQAKGKVQLKSGLFTLPRQILSHSLVFEAGDIPSIPKYHINDLKVTEKIMSDGKKGLAAEASIKIKNDHPVGLTIPPLGFNILVPNCQMSDSPLRLADAFTSITDVNPNQYVPVNVTAFVSHLPNAILATCPSSDKSPLDKLLGKYIHGNDTNIYVQGTNSPDPKTPKWISELMSDITVPIPIPGHEVGSLIKEFSLDDVHFSMPDFFAPPNSPESKPAISANITALIDLPEEVKFPLNVHRVKADTDLYYHKKKFAVLDLSKWQKATSKLVEDEDSKTDLQLRSAVEKAPLDITDSSIFTEVVQELLTGSSGVKLVAKANVDVEVETALGKLVVKDIPAKGDVPVNPLGNGGFGTLEPQVDSLQIVETKPDALTLSASVNFTNPTKYSAEVPFVDIEILVNDTIVGHAIAEGVSLRRGNNSGISVRLLWEPAKQSGKEGAAVGRELISQFLSGYNASVTFRTYEGSIPAQPALGKALSALNVTLPIPRLGKPGDGDGDGDDEGGGVHFIKDTTMHIFSSTATFVLDSPLNHTTILITHINATALYEGDPVGTIDYDGEPLVVPPGLSETPRLDVAWSLDSVGFDAIRQALGGTLRLAAVAGVGVRIGRWEERLWYEGSGIGTKIRP